MSSSPPKVDEKAKDGPSTKPKIFIIFYTTYLHIYKLALAIQKGIEAEGRCEVQIFQLAETLSVEALKKIRAPPKPDVPIITPQLLTEADGILFGFPTRYGTLPAQLKEFLDACGRLWADGSLNGKMAGAFVSSATQHGGQETSIFSLLTSMAHFGMLYVPLGYASLHLKNGDTITGGSPWGATVSAGKDGTRQPSEQELETAEIQGREFSRTVARFNFQDVPTVDKKTEAPPMVVGSSNKAERTSAALDLVGTTENSPKGSQNEVKEGEEEVVILPSDVQNTSLEEGVPTNAESLKVSDEAGGSKDGSPYFKGLSTLASFSFEANHLDLGKGLLSLPQAPLSLTPDKEEEALALPSPKHDPVTAEEIQELSSTSAIKLDEHIPSATHDTTPALQAPIPASDSTTIAPPHAATVDVPSLAVPVKNYDESENNITPVTAHEEAEREFSPVTAHEEMGDETENVTPVTAPEEAEDIAHVTAPTSIVLENGAAPKEAVGGLTNGAPEEEPVVDKSDGLAPVVATEFNPTRIEEVVSPGIESRGIMASQAFNATPIESPANAGEENKPQVSPHELAVQKMPSLLDIAIPTTATEAAGLHKKASQSLALNEAASEAKAPGTESIKTAPSQNTTHSRKHSFAKASATNLRKFFKSFSVRSKPNDMT